MKPGFAASIMLVGFLSGVCSAAPLPKKANDGAIRKELEAKYKALERAFQQKDEKAMWSMTTPDYAVKQPDGRVLTREMLEPGFKQQMAMSHDVKWPRKITKLTVEEDRAIATVDGRFAAKIDGAGGKKQQMLLVATTRDTWVKTPDGWKLQLSEVQKNHVTIDGKTAGPPPSTSKQ